MRPVRNFRVVGSRSLSRKTHYLAFKFGKKQASFLRLKSFLCSVKRLQRIGRLSPKEKAQVVSDALLNHWLSPRDHLLVKKFFYMQYEDFADWASKLNLNKAQRLLVRIEKIIFQLENGHGKFGLIAANFEKMATDQEAAGLLRHSLNSVTQWAMSATKLASGSLERRIKQLESKG